MGHRPGSSRHGVALLVAASMLLIALGGAFHHHGVASQDHDCPVCLAYHAGGQAVASAPPIVFSVPVCGVVERISLRPVERVAPRAIARGPPTTA
ncbi:MAG: hypothetical protein R3B57_02820 [Phycisphaerales bacterium]